VVEQTRLLIEEEFRDLFVGSSKVDNGAWRGRASEDTVGGYSLDQLKGQDEREDLTDEKYGKEEEEEMLLPRMRLSVDH
jgi:hypothetical protein